MVEIKTEAEYLAVKRCVEIARDFSKSHFHADKCETSTLIDPPCFRVVFPDVDRMMVTPMMYGLPCGPDIHYRLRFDHKHGGAVSWHPTELLYGLRRLPDLPVPRPALGKSVETKS